MSLVRLDLSEATEHRSISGLRIRIPVLLAVLMIGVLALDGAISVARNAPPFSASFSIVSQSLANSFGRINLRSGYLASNQFIRSKLEKNLKPFDVILVSAPFKGTSVTTPGKLTHTGIWLGTQDDWKQSGWDRIPNLQPLYQSVREGASVLQSGRLGVSTAALTDLLNSDEISVYRSSNLKSPDFYFDRVVQNMGKAYDYNLDGLDQQRMICTELVADIFPSIPISMSTRLGRQFILPDQLHQGLQQAVGWNSWFHEGRQD